MKKARPVSCSRLKLRSRGAAQSITRPGILAGGLLILLALPRLSCADTLVQYTFGPDGSSPGVLTPAQVGFGIIATSITSDPGLTLDLTNPATQPTTTPYLRTTFVTASLTPDAAVANQADFKFTLSADAGSLLDLSSLNFDAMRGGAGTPRGYQVRSSADNYATSLGGADLLTARPTFTPVVIDLSGAAFDNLSTITFKIFSYSPATGSSVDYDSIVVNGVRISLPAGGYTWKGNVNGNWNTTTANWTGPGTVYVDGTVNSDVIFDDSAVSTAVTITPSSVNPDSMNLDNTTANYTFSGNSIVVAAALGKTGAGAVTFNNSVSAAAVLASGGTLTVASGGSLTSPQITVGAAAALTVASGGTIGAASALFANGVVTLGNAAQTLSALSGLSTGMLVLNGTLLNVTGDSTFDGQVTGSGSIVKNTAGNLTLNGPNDFTGGITITAGAVRIGNATGAGSGITTVNAGGILALSVPVTNPITPSTTSIILAGGIVGSIGNQTTSGDISVTSDSTVDVFNPVTNASPADLIVTGSLLGTGNLQVASRNGASPDGSAFRLRGPVSSYSGRITLEASAKFEVQTSATSGSPMGTGTLVVTGGSTSQGNGGTYSLINVRNNSGTDTSFGNNVAVIGFGASYFNLLGNAVPGSVATFGDLLIGDGQAIGAVATASAAFTLGFATVHLNGGNITFTPQPVANTSFLSIENIRLGAITENSPSSITMNGAATLTLAGASIYTGATIVNSGTFQVTGSISGSSGITVNGGTLTGGGSIGSPVAIGDADPTASAILDAGGVNIIGTLTTGLLSLNGPDAQLHLQLNSDELTTDLLVVNGALTLGPGTATFLPTDLGFTVLSNGEQFVVATASGGVGGFFAGYPQGATVDIGSTPFKISYQNNAITLVAAPEPTAGMFLLTGFSTLLALRRLRQRAA